MKRLFLGIVSNTIMVGLPLIAAPHLILHYKALLIIAAGIAVWLTQPAIAAEETAAQKEKDKLSVVLILTMSAISVIAPVTHWAYIMEEHSSFTVFTAVGIFIVASGIIFRAWAVNTLGKFFTATVQIKEDHQLITKGPYSIVRHPSYTGAFLSITGCAIILESWIGFVIAIIAMTIAYYVRIKVEEAQLSAHFGTAYSAYKNNTKRIIPFIW